MCTSLSLYEWGCLSFCQLYSAAFSSIDPRVDIPTAPLSPGIPAEGKEGGTPLPPPQYGTTIPLPFPFRFTIILPKKKTCRMVQNTFDLTPRIAPKYDMRREASFQRSIKDCPPTRRRSRLNSRTWERRLASRRSEWRRTSFSTHCWLYV